MKQWLRLLAIASLLFFSVAGCVAPRGDSPEEKRAAIQRMKAETLKFLYQEQPTAQELLEKSAGYAVFSNVRAMMIFGSGGAGFGVAVDSRTGRETYMQMAQGGVGLGVGLQDVRVVLVYHSQRAFDNFIANGWEFGVQADAAATAREKGGEVARELSVENEMSVYALTEAGLMAKVDLVGTKYWRDDSLN